MTHKRKRHPENSVQALRQFVIDTFLLLPQLLWQLFGVAIGLILATGLTLFILVILPQLTGWLFYTRL
jgi:hypothetical protein